MNRLYRNSEEYLPDSVRWLRCEGFFEYFRSQGVTWVPSVPETHFEAKFEMQKAYVFHDTVEHSHSLHTLVWPHNLGNKPLKDNPFPEHLSLPSSALHLLIK